LLVYTEQLKIIRLFESATATALIYTLNVIVLMHTVNCFLVNLLYILACAVILFLLSHNA